MVRPHVTPEPWIERRQDARQFMHVAGTAVVDGDLLRIPVTVVNISRSGLMVELPAGTDIPAEATFLFGHRLEPCQLIWHEGDLAGFNFIELPG